MTEYINGIRQFEPGFDLKMHWAPIREAVLSILGITGIIVPIGDAQHEATDRTTCTSVGDQQVVFTYSKAVTTFDTPPFFFGPGYVPIVSFDGTDEGADTPDVAYFSRGNGSADSAFSLGLWLYPTNAGGTYQQPFSKDNNTDREWGLEIDDPAVPIPALRLWDDSAAVSCSRPLSAVLTLSTWAFVVFTYDGAGGATAANTIKAYKNGALANGTAVNHANYVAMEDLTALPSIGVMSGEIATRFYGGKLAGGPLGPFFVQAELTADVVNRLYQLGRNYMGV